MIAYINKRIWGWMVTQNLASVLATCFNNMERYQAGKVHGHPDFLPPHPVGTFLPIFGKKSKNLQVSGWGKHTHNVTRAHSTLEALRFCGMWTKSLTGVIACVYYSKSAISLLFCHAWSIGTTELIVKNKQNESPDLRRLPEIPGKCKRTSFLWLLSIAALIR